MWKPEKSYFFRIKYPLKLFVLGVCRCSDTILDSFQSRGRRTLLPLGLCRSEGLGRSHSLRCRPTTEFRRWRARCTSLPSLLRWRREDARHHASGSSLLRSAFRHQAGCKQKFWRVYTTIIFTYVASIWEYSKIIMASYFGAYCKTYSKKNYRIRKTYFFIDCMIPASCAWGSK